MRAHLIGVLIALGMGSSLFAQTVISTFAGGVPLNGPALSLPLPAVNDVKADSAGNLYIAVAYYNVVYKLDPTGNLSRIAGSGIESFGGDGGAATSAQLNAPNGLALDRQGNLYIADYGNWRVRKLVLSTGIITTVAGSGPPAGAAICVSPCVAGDGGPPTAAVVHPWAVATDSVGNLFIADDLRVREVTGSVITTVAGNGTFGSSGDGGAANASQLFARGIAIDASDALYVSDIAGNKVRKVLGGLINSVAGNGQQGFSGDGGSATLAMLTAPGALAFDATGSLYLADLYRVRKVTGGVINTVAGSGIFGGSGDGGSALAAQISPVGLSVDLSGNLLIADSAANRVRRVQGGLISAVAGSGQFAFNGDNIAATSAPLAQAMDSATMALDSRGNFYFSEPLNHRVRKIAANGVLSTVAGTGTAGFSGDGAAATSSQLNQPRGVAVDAQGRLYIADSQNGRVRRIETDGTITTVAAGLRLPWSVAVDSANNVYIADYADARIRQLTNGQMTTLAGTGVASSQSCATGAATSVTLGAPQALAVDSAGSVYFTDALVNCVRRVRAGTVELVAGQGNASGFSGDGGLATSAVFNTISGISLDSAGNLYIADQKNHRIRKVTNGTIATIVGNGTAGFAGDGGVPASGVINQPAGVLSDANGNLYIADSGNYRIRLVGTGVVQVGSVSAVVVTSPVDLAITIDGVVYNAPQLFNWVPGSTHQVSVTSPQIGPGNQQWAFTSWNDQGAQSHTVTAGAANSSIFLQANFAPPVITCAFTLGATQVYFSKAAAVGNVSFTATNPSCPWTASTATTWLTLASATSGNGSGNLTYTVAQDFGAGRFGTITIAGQTLTVVQATDNASFVSQTYQDILNRPVDAGGLNFWVGQLNAGVATRSQLVSNLFSSSEMTATGLYVVKLYEAILRRDPEYGGWSFWFNSLRNGGTQQAALDAFLASTEFQTTYGSLSNQDFVNLVYQNVLGRAPDSGGLAFWLGQLNSGAITRGTMMFDFINAPEYDTNVRPRAYVTLLYLALLRRSPDAAGVTFWMSQEALPGGLPPVIDKFLASQEYLNRF